MLKKKELVQLSNCYPYDPMSYNLKEGGTQGRLSEYSQTIRINHCRYTWKSKSIEERAAFSEKCRNRSIGNKNPMYGKDWRDGKTEEEILLHNQRIKNSHKKKNS